MSLSPQQVQEWISLAKDILTAAAVVTASVVAAVGLQTWKKQLRGKTQYDVARPPASLGLQG